MKKQKSISKIFAAYIVIFCITAVILMILDLGLFTIGFSSGIIIPANYYEQKIEQHRNDIAKAEDVKSLIPNECYYAVYDLEGNVLQGNASKEKFQKMWDIIQSGQISDGHLYYKIIQRNREICIVEYTLISNFSNSTLRKYIPSTEFLIPVVYIILIISEIIIFSKCFKKKIIKEMQILKDTTKNIQMENLDFEMKYSNVIEINEVLSALDKMKIELNASLKEQWKMEEIRKEQIVALAHDLKTPLTIIKGNSELLNELALRSDQKEFNYGILNAANNMEVYTKSLMEIVKSEKETTIQRKQINLNKLIEDIMELGQSMSINKKLKFICKINHTSEFILADEIALKRAISNVISNAIDYSPENGEVHFYTDSNDKYVRFIIEDSGRGFTEEEVNSATEQFFQGDKSRNSKGHYGLGLYIARKFIEQHRGNIYLENSKELGGAKVTIEVPV